VHQLDPRSKLIGLGILGVGVFFLNHWYEYALWTMLALGLAWLAKLSWSEWSQGFFAVSLLMAVTFFLQLIFTPGEVLVQLGPLAITRQGFTSGVNLVGRLVFLATFSALLAFTTPSMKLSDGIYALFGTLKKRSIRLAQFALVVGLSARFVPLLFAQGEQILKAQRARGIDFSVGTITQRAKRIITLFIPLFYSSLERAHRLSLAMEARGYRLGSSRSQWKTLRFSVDDWLWLSVALFCVLSVIILA
jgi:energy-coupling factor transport system permease protein